MPQKINSSQAAANTEVFRGLAIRTNINKTHASATAGTWYYIRNDADTANLSVEVQSTGGQLIVEVVVVAWSNANQYKRIRLLSNGSTTGVTPDNFPVSYLSSGVAPGLAVFTLSPAAGTYTFTVQLQIESGATATLDYRSCSIKVTEVIGA